MKVGAMSYAKLIALLDEGVHNTQDLVDELGICAATLRAYIKALRKEGMVHVAAWEPDGRGAESIAVWALGRNKDAKRKPKHANQYARTKAYRARLRAKLMIERMAG